MNNYFEKNVKQQLDLSVATLDAMTQSRLTQARYKALEYAKTKSIKLGRWHTGLASAAAVALLVITVMPTLQIPDQQQLATNTQQLTADKQQLATNTQQLTADKQQLATNSRQLATDKQQLTTNTQQLAADKQQLATNTQQLTADKQQMTINNQQLTPSSEWLSVSDMNEIELYQYLDFYLWLDNTAGSNS